MAPEPTSQRDELSQLRQPASETKSERSVYLPNVTQPELPPHDLEIHVVFLDCKISPKSNTSKILVKFNGSLSFIL